MKKSVTFICIFLLVGFFSCAYSQKEKARYGIVVENIQGKPKYKSQKRQLIDFLKHIETSSYEPIDLRGKIKTLNYEKENYSDVEKSLLPDSIRGVFKINKIIKKKNNYQTQGNKLVRRVIYLIDIENIDTTQKYPQYIRLLSLDNQPNQYKRIKEGEQYEMTIYSFFDKDCCAPIKNNGKITYLIRKPDEHLSSILYENIWIVYIDISSYNLFETPYLKGLYYIRSE